MAKQAWIRVLYFFFIFTFKNAEALRDNGVTALGEFW